ncbi:MAG: VCBS repeat-containing protein [Candidatus Aenigmarchaeota archaeon]|nr:VCBS repeat-containing protein [Candidatus Aenigmarchaeota archaeon]
MKERFKPKGKNIIDTMGFCKNLLSVGLLFISLYSPAVGEPYSSAGIGDKIECRSYKSNAELGSHICRSSRTYDLDGDGKADMLYADENGRVFFMKGLDNDFSFPAKIIAGPYSKDRKKYCIHVEHDNSGTHIILHTETEQVVVEQQTYEIVIYIYNLWFFLLPKKLA